MEKQEHEHEDQATPATGQKRKRRSRQEVDAWVERYRRSGQTQTAFAAEHGIEVGTFRQWLYRRDQKAEAPGRLLPVRVVEDGGRVPAVVVRFPGGVEVEFVRGVEISDLIRLIGGGGSARC
jgi:hypothetical protein